METSVETKAPPENETLCVDIAKKQGPYQGQREQESSSWTLSVQHMQEQHKNYRPPLPYLPSQCGPLKHHHLSHQYTLSMIGYVCSRCMDIMGNVSKFE